MRAWFTLRPCGGHFTKYLGFSLFNYFSRDPPSSRDRIFIKVFTNGNFHKLSIWPNIFVNVDNYRFPHASCFCPESILLDSVAYEKKWVQVLKYTLSRNELVCKCVEKHFSVDWPSQFSKFFGYKKKKSIRRKNCYLENRPYFKK